jgi:hypothetical protein
VRAASSSIVSKMKNWARPGRQSKSPLCVVTVGFSYRLLVRKVHLCTHGIAINDIKSGCFRAAWSGFSRTRQ